MFTRLVPALRRSILPIVALGAFYSQAAAVPVHVTLDWPASAPASARANITIQAVRAAGATDDSGPVQVEAGPNGAVLNLSEGVWQVEASAPGYWSQDAEVIVSRSAPSSARLTFWPAASLRGEVATTEGESLPFGLEIQLSAAPASAAGTSAPAAAPQNDQRPSHAKLYCKIASGTWSCLGPSGLFDVRLEAPGYASRYEWAVNLQAAQTTDFGRTELRKAASVFAQAILKNAPVPPRSCRATLEPDMARHGPSESGQESDPGPDAKTRFSAPLNQRGFFQIVGVMPGRYAIFVGCPAASAFRQLRVQADSETRIDPPLLLEDLTLNISIAPKTDPSGQPWRLVVDETAPHYLRISGNAATASDGHWTRRGLMAGNYRVTVRGSDGASWLQQYFDLNKSTGPLSLRVGSVSVTGRVTMSSRPVRARLVFTNDGGTGESATLSSDDNGRFQGQLPVASSVESSWTVEAQVAQPPVTQQLLDVSVRRNSTGPTWLDLDLPAVPVHGSVVSLDGKLQPNAQVTFENSSGVRSSTSTDSAGKFEMLDLQPGKYTAGANSYDGSSDRIPIEVTEAGGSELKLVLNPYKLTSFNVVSNQGPVADAAVQVWIAPGVPGAFLRSDENGRFDVSLPPGTTEVGLTVGAPGYAIKMTRQPIASGGDEPADAHTITLDTTAGTLVLNFHPPGRPMDNSTLLYLVHKGAIQDARTLAGWGTDQAGVGDNASGNVPVTIDAIEPGDYALCVITDPSQVASIWSGALPASLCTKGSLDEDETLTLSPP